MRKEIAIILAMTFALMARGGDYAPMWKGTMLPYPYSATPTTAPDTLEPVFAIRVSRHGARYLSSRKKVSGPRKLLERIKTLTPLGGDFLALLGRVDSLTAGRWGLLTPLGLAEEDSLASRFFERWEAPGEIGALSSPVPRVVASMYAFVGRINEMDPKRGVETYAGPATDTLTRFFEADRADSAFRASTEVDRAISEFEEAKVPLRPALALVGESSGLTNKELRSLTMDVYEILSSMSAMGVEESPDAYLRPEEYKACWEASNYARYVRNSASRLSKEPERGAAPLLRYIIGQIDRYTREGGERSATLVFGHAETLLPLLSLMRVPGGRSAGAEADEVSGEWRASELAPLAGWVEIDNYRSPSGVIYTRILLNGRPINGRGAEFMAWKGIKRQWEGYLNELIDSEVK